MPSQPPDGVEFPSDGSLPVAVVAAAAAVPLSIYVHVPFCRTRCGYCDFNTYTASELPGTSITDYVDGIAAELRLARRVLQDPPAVSTVFFGGGTPTLLPAEELAEILQWIRDEFGLAADAEVTTEANPDTVDPAYFETLRAAGFTRVSLGMQSAVPHVLDVLERVHTPGRALEAAHWAHRAGFDHVSLDLIFGTPGETRDDWQRSLDAVDAAPVDHVSAYSLIVEPGTRLALQVRRGDLSMPDEDDLAEKYLMAERHLVDRGFRNYETSNWAMTPESRCRHNLAYWWGANWWGLGPGSHSHVSGVRFWNRRHPRSWVGELAAGRSPIQAGEYLTDEERRVERILLEVRLAEGLPLDLLTPSERGRVSGVVDGGLAVVQDDRLLLTLPGRLLADGIVRDLLD